MIDLIEKINQLHTTPSDINEHIPTLIKYGAECNHITEMGVRWIVSTWAFLGCKPKKMISYDIENPSKWGANIDDVYEVAKFQEIDFQFIQANVREIEIEETDLLFLDTWHIYEQLNAELTLHGNKSRKYIICHDTTAFAEDNKVTGERGIWKAIEEFLNNNVDKWELCERFTNNQGLTILKRKV